MALTFAADQFRTGGHVAPLVAAAHLEHAAHFFPEVVEVIALHQLVTELREAHPAFQPVFDGVFGHHVVDRDVFAHVADEVQKAQVLEPVEVVDHPGGRRTFKIEEALQLRALACEVVVQRFEVEKLALCGLAAGVAHHAGSASHQGHRSVSRPL